MNILVWFMIAGQVPQPGYDKVNIVMEFQPGDVWFFNQHFMVDSVLVIINIAYCYP